MLREYVGKCYACEKDIHCHDGYLDGEILSCGVLVCFNCENKENPSMHLSNFLDH